MKMKGENVVGEIDVKRFYLPGVEIESTCSNCKNVHDWDNYLSYPILDKPLEMNFYCGDCDHEWVENVILSLSVKQA